MKGYKVLMTQPAANDLKEIAAYIANELREPSIAKKLVAKIKEAVNRCGFARAIGAQQGKNTAFSNVKLIF